MTTKEDREKALDDLEKWMNAIYAPRHQHKNFEIIRAALTEQATPVDLEGVSTCLDLIDNVLGRCYRDKTAVPYGRLQQYITSARKHLRTPDRAEYEKLKGKP